MTKAQGQKRRAHGMVPLAGPQSAQMHAGIGSATKPAYEPIVCARKPLSEKNLVQNILKHGEWLEDGTVYKVGTGGLQIDQSRVNGTPRTTHADGNYTGAQNGKVAYSPYGEGYQNDAPTGRFPSNTLWSHVPGPNGCQRVGSRRVSNGRWGKDKPSETYKETNGYEGGWGDAARTGYADPDGLEEVPEYICAKDENGDYVCPVALLDEQSGNRESRPGKKKPTAGTGYGQYKRLEDGPSYPGDQGGASRFFVNFSPDPNPGFFYSPKASQAERNRGLEGMPEKHKNEIYGNGFSTATKLDPKLHTAEGVEGRPKYQNTHPTVKPVKLLSYLVKLVTPPNGTVLDPFAGSGSTGVAALTEGFNAILIEAEPEYVEIIERRCAHTLSERVEPKKGEVRTAKEWGLENVHPQDTPLRYNPDECPEEGGTFEPVEEWWEDKRTGPEPDDLTYREVIEKFAAALAKTEEQFKDRLF